MLLLKFLSPKDYSMNISVIHNRIQIFTWKIYIILIQSQSFPNVSSTRAMICSSRAKINVPHRTFMSVSKSLFSILSSCSCSKYTSSACLKAVFMKHNCFLIPQMNVEGFTYNSISDVWNIFSMTVHITY